KISIEDMEAKLSEILGEEVEVFEKDKYVYIKDNTPYYSYVYLTMMEDGVYDVVINAKESNLLDKISQISGFDYTGNDIYGVDRTITITEGLPGLTGSTYTFYDSDRNILILDGKAVVANESFVGTINLVAYSLMPKIPHIFVLCDNNELSTNCAYGTGTDFSKNAILIMHNFENVYDYYNEILGCKSFDGEGGKIIVTTGVSDKFFNLRTHDNKQASWLGSVMSEFIFGNREGVSYASQLDLVAHEYTHAVSDHIVNFVYENESGSLDEAYSDIMGSLIEGKNFQLGEGFGTARDMTNPNQYEAPAIKGGKYYFPTDTETYNDEWKMEMELGEDWQSWDYGGIHTNSTVVSHAAYLMYDNGVFESKEEMAKVWYNSLHMLSPTSDFEDCALAVIKTAKNFGLNEDEIKLIEDAFVTTNMLSRESVSLSGKVTDNSTAKTIGGVTVVAINKLNPHVNYTVTTDNNGEYKFEKLPMMDYTITFEKPKYKMLEREMILGKGDNTLDVKLTAVKEGNYKKSEMVFVLDISKSMDDTDPTDVRKQIIGNIVSSLDSSAEVGLVVFAKTGTVFNKGLSNKSVDKKILITDIFNMTNDSGYTDNSGTNGREGLNTGMQLFGSTSDSRKYIVFLTDGEDNEDSGPTYGELIEQANSMNVRILTIGLGEEDQINSEILKKLAIETNGKYYYANKSTNLYDFDKKIFEELE
ncbi:MAG: M4 family metallopeptidase, partial [Bacilli bacterium]|nr:M4 family metallopeptidase [Bacilli bacterium]